MSSKAGSPKMLVTVNHRRATLLVDEGSKINCVNKDFADKNYIRFELTNSSATAAGNGNLDVSGCRRVELRLCTKFQSTPVEINMGKATVIKNLGVSLLLGEPGKASNSIITDSKKRLIYVDRLGHIMSKSYYDESDTSPSICKIEDRKVRCSPKTREAACPGELSAQRSCHHTKSSFRGILLTENRLCRGHGPDHQHGQLPSQPQET